MRAATDDIRDEMREVVRAAANTTLLSNLNASLEWKAFFDQLTKMLDSVKDSLILEPEPLNIARKQGEARGIQRVLNLVASADARAADLAEESKILSSEMAAIGA